jgi:hypothetical protein
MEEGLKRDGKEASEGSFDLLEAFVFLEVVTPFCCPFS